MATEVEYRKSITDEAVPIRCQRPAEFGRFPRLRSEIRYLIIILVPSRETNQKRPGRGNSDLQMRKNRNGPNPIWGPGRFAVGSAPRQCRVSWQQPTLWSPQWWPRWIVRSPFFGVVHIVRLGMNLRQKPNCDCHARRPRNPLRFFPVGLLRRP